jgi:hypothetical protein
MARKILEERGTKIAVFTIVFLLNVYLEWLGEERHLGILKEIP